MGNITLSVPEVLHRRLQKHPELKWSEIARQAFEKKLKELELEEKILAKSTLTEKDAEEIAHKIDRAVAKKLGLA